jgi:hypothetical protein
MFVHGVGDDSARTSNMDDEKFMVALSLLLGMPLLLNSLD